MQELEFNYTKTGSIRTCFLVELIRAGISGSSWIESYEAGDNIFVGETSTLQARHKFKTALEEAGIDPEQDMASALAVLGGKYYITLKHQQGTLKGLNGKATTTLNRAWVFQGLSTLASNYEFFMDVLDSDCELDEHELKKYGNALLQCCVYGRIIHELPPLRTDQ
jgi:hypothetical protein